MVEQGERVRITTFTGGETSLPAVVSQFQGQALHLIASSSILAGQPVRVEIQNGMLLGECVFCVPASGGHMIGLEIEQALLHLDSLANLVANLVGTAPQVPLIADSR